MSLIVHLALVCHVFIAVAVMAMVCGRHGIVPIGYAVCKHYNRDVRPSVCPFVTLLYCNSCASLAWLVLCFIVSFIVVVIPP